MESSEAVLVHLRLGRMQEHDTGRYSIEVNEEPLPSTAGCDLQGAKAAGPAGTLRWVCEVAFPVDRSDSCLGVLSTATLEHHVRAGLSREQMCPLGLLSCCVL